MHQENRDLKEEIDIVLQEKERLQETVVDLRKQIPSTPHRITKGILNTIIVLFVLVFVVSGGLFCMEVFPILEEKYQRVSSGKQRVAEVRAKAEAIEDYNEKVSQYPKVQIVSFGERLTFSTLKNHSVSGAKRHFYAFRQPSESFVEFDLELIARNIAPDDEEEEEEGDGVARAFLNIYETGKARVYQEKVSSGRHLIFLPEGNYRFSLRHVESSSNPPVIPGGITVYRLVRETDTRIKVQR